MSPSIAPALHDSKTELTKLWREVQATMSTPIKIYELYPRRGSFSVKTDDYDGTMLTVAATSVRQAYAMAHHDNWISADDVHPVGIVSIDRRHTGTTLWCGCSGHGVTGGSVRHGAGITALRKAIEAHRCPRRQPPTLRQRLQAAAASAQEA